MPVPDGGLIDRDYAKDAVGWVGKNTKDALFDDMIVAATPVVERLCGPVLQRTRTITRSGGKSGVLLPDHLPDGAVITSVVENDVAITDFFVNTAAGIVYAGTRTQSRQFLAGMQNITVTYTVGYAAGEVPKPIQLAVRALVKIWFQQDQSSGRPSFDDAGESDSFTVPQGFAVPRKVREMLAPYQRPAGFA